MSGSVPSEIQNNQIITSLPFPKTLNDLYRLPITLTDKPSNALLDTGAIASFISVDLFSKLTPKKVENVKNIGIAPQFTSASGNSIKP